MPTPRSGSCLCGEVAFTADTDNVLMAAHCHCLDCKKATGSAFATVVAIPDEALTIEHGEPGAWTVTGMSGQVTRYFCPRCGSPMLTRSTGSPGLVFVKAGVFDDSSWIEPAIECWTIRRAAWGRIPADLPGVETNP